MEAPESLCSYTCYTVYFVYCVNTKNEKQEIGEWIHLQKTIVFHFYQKQFLLLLFLFFFKILISWRHLKLSEILLIFFQVQSYAGHKPGQTPKEP